MNGIGVREVNDKAAKSEMRRPSGITVIGLGLGGSSTIGEEGTTDGDKDSLRVVDFLIEGKQDLKKESINDKRVIATSDANIVLG